MIGIFDPAISSKNLGDEIISEAVIGVLREIYPVDFFLKIPTQEKISVATYRKLRQCRLGFVGGTNLLSSNMVRRRQWKIGLLDSIFIRRPILLGVGWWQYQGEPDAYTRAVLERSLSKDLIHSVRDEYTKAKLFKIGIRNVVNTGCPTMWGLNQSHLEAVSTDKTDCVVTTLTHYSKKPDRDQAMLNLIFRHYRKVYFWPQGSGDLSYLEQLGLKASVNVLSSSLSAFDKVLANEAEPVDYIGTRLHAGIRALQFKRRSVVVPVDNRATEISKDTGLPIINGDLEDGLRSFFHNHYEARISLQIKNIQLWKSQFTQGI
jgi:polysaccharide pyruvyl transferase WcaK-like protein